MQQIYSHMRHTKKIYILPWSIILCKQDLRFFYHELKQHVFSSDDGLLQKQFHTICNKIICLLMNFYLTGIRMLQIQLHMIQTKFFVSTWTEITCLFIQWPFANLVSHNLQWNLCIHMNLGNITLKIWWVLSKPLLHNLQFNFLKASGIILRYLLTESYKIWLNNRILRWRTDFLD